MSRVLREINHYKSRRNESPGSPGSVSSLLSVYSDTIYKPANKRWLLKWPRSDRTPPPFVFPFSPPHEHVFSSTDGESEEELRDSRSGSSGLPQVSLDDFLREVEVSTCESSDETSTLSRRPSSERIKAQRRSSTGKTEYVVPSSDEEDAEASSSDEGKKGRASDHDWQASISDEEETEDSESSEEEVEAIPSPPPRRRRPKRFTFGPSFSTKFCWICHELLCKHRPNPPAGHDVDDFDPERMFADPDDGSVSSFSSGSVQLRGYLPDETNVEVADGRTHRRMRDGIVMDIGTNLGRVRPKFFARLRNYFWFRCRILLAPGQRQYKLKNMWLDLPCGWEKRKIDRRDNKRVDKKKPLPAIQHVVRAMRKDLGLRRSILTGSRCLGALCFQITKENDVLLFTRPSGGR